MQIKLKICKPFVNNITALEFYIMINKNSLSCFVNGNKRFNLYSISIRLY